MFLLRLGSKRDIKYKLSTEDFLKNLCTITNIYDDKTANIEHKGNLFDVIELYESSKKKQTRFVWLTNFKIGKNNITKIARGARLRWKIENEGFNIQKNRGFNLEHPYSQNEIAMKNYLLLLQIAYIISQLMEKGSLLKDKILKGFGSVTKLFKQLLEDLRTKLIGDNFSKKPIQIRLSSFP